MYQNYIFGKTFSAVLDKILKISKNITYVSFSLNIWTEKCNSRSYLDITSNFLDDNLNIQSVSFFILNLPKTNLKIQSIIDDIIKALFPKLIYPYYVTDNGSNIV